MPSIFLTDTRLFRLSTSRMIVLLWAFYAAEHAVIAMLSTTNRAHLWELLVTALTGMTLSLAIYEFARQLMVKVSTRFAVSLILILSMLGGTAVWAANALLQYWAGPYGVPPKGAWSGGPIDYLIRLRYNWSYFTDLFLLQSLIFALINYVKKLKIRERQLVEARLAALRLQLNPHFLFNTLNAITTLVAEAGATDAELMIVRLSNFLRISLSTEATEGLVSLAFELDTIQAYLEIESVRFNDRLAIHYACAAGLADAQVPSLILQPLVENAIKYAVAPSKELVTILIEARAAGTDLILVVEDDGKHTHVDTEITGTGVGLRNVAARLEALYGRAGRIEAVKRERGFTAVVRLPLHRTRT